MAEAVAEYTGLDKFPQYLTLLFEVDALFCNDDRHLNNIAVIEQEGRYSYCPIFDNGAGLLSNTRLLQMDIDPEPLVSSLAGQAVPNHIHPAEERRPQPYRETACTAKADCGANPGNGCGPCWNTIPPGTGTVLCNGFPPAF